MLSIKQSVLSTICLFVFLFSSSCKKNLEKKEEIIETRYGDIAIKEAIQIFSDYSRHRNAIYKREFPKISVDSFAYYLRIVSNGLVSDLDSSLVDLKQSEQLVEIKYTSNGLFDYDYFYDKVIEFSGEIKKTLQPNQRIYNIESFEFIGPNLIKFYYFLGTLKSSSFLGKAVDPNSGLYFFGITDSYRFGYGNEYSFLLPNGLKDVYGGRAPINSSPKGNGNGLVDLWFGQFVWYGGSSTNSLPQNINQKFSGAAKMLETFGQNNIFSTIGWPSSAPIGFKYLYSDYISLEYDYRDCFTKSNPSYQFGNSNREFQFLPAMIAAKFCFEYGQSGFSINGVQVKQPVMLNSNQLNYFLNKIPAIYSAIKNSNSGLISDRVFYRFDVVPLYDEGDFYTSELNCSGICNPACKFHSTQLFETFDPIFFPDQNECAYVKYKHKYRIVFARRTLVPDPNPF